LARLPRLRRPRKACPFCKAKANFIDYKNVSLLHRFVSEKGRMLSKRATGNCAKHQRKVAVAIKRAREIALLPFVVR